jgi:hypothetical protein
VFRDYITVQPGERFAFDKVNESMRQDVHPPLSFYALHFVSSLFPNQFSKWFGLAVNLVCYGLTIWCLYGLALRVFGTTARALFATAVWAFSLGAIDTVMYIRMYCPLTLFSVAAAYFLVRYDRGEGRKYLPLVYLSFILGGMTDYIYWIFGFFLTAAFVLMRWRRWRVAAGFAGTALAAFLSACAILPITITQFIKKDSFSRQVGDSLGVGRTLSRLLDVPFVFNRLLDNFAEQTFFMPAAVMVWLLAAGCVAVVVGLLVLAVRREAAVAGAGTSYWGSVGAKIKSACQAAAERGALYVFVAALLTAYTLGAVFPDFQLWTVRAFFFLYPFASLAFAALVIWLYKRAGLNRYVLLGAMVLLAGREYFIVKSPFLFPGGYERINKKLDNANVILVLDSLESAGRIPSFCYPLSKAHSVYIMLVGGPDYRQELLEAVRTADKSRKLMVINTCGAPPASFGAMSVIGPELLLTHDQQLFAALQEKGYGMELKKKYANIFQCFSLYEVAKAGAAAGQ